jgi:hypothetical protein
MRGMKMEENTNNCSSNDLIDRLPELSETEKEIALENKALSWALSLLSEDMSGMVAEERDYGLILQSVSSSIVRCITVVDHPYCLLVLQQMRITFGHLNAELEVGPYTVIRLPMENISAVNKEDETSGSTGGPAVNQEIGMEVA